MSQSIKIQPISAEIFEPFGDLITCDGSPDTLINQGLCGRYHDRADLVFEDGRAGISLFHSQIRRLPLSLEMMERHPLGSQAFVPMEEVSFLVVVAPDHDGAFGSAKASHQFQSEHLAWGSYAH